MFRFNLNIKPIRPIRIILADKQYLIREGLKRLFSGKEEYKLVGECSEKGELFSRLHEYSVDILILDHTHQDNFCINDILLLYSISPDTKILIISDDNNRETVQQVVEYGVKGYLTKTCDSAEIFEAMDALMNGEKMFCHKVVDILLDKPVHDASDCTPTILSDREIEIIRLIACGYTTKTIAETLFRSFHTVSTHRKNIMKKLGKKTTSELLMYAMNTGLLQPNNSVSAVR